MDLSVLCVCFWFIGFQERKHVYVTYSFLFFSALWIKFVLLYKKMKISIYKFFFKEYLRNNWGRNGYGLCHQSQIHSPYSSPINKQPHSSLVLSFSHFLFISRLAQGKNNSFIYSTLLFINENVPIWTVSIETHNTLITVYSLNQHINYIHLSKKKTLDTNN